MINAIINIHKEKGFTSHDVVAKLRGIVRQKKIGHTGTLDPDATGVLPVCMGSATRLCDILADHDKAYRAVCRLGVVTDTQDMSGTVIEEKQVDVTEEKVRDAINSFIGGYDQIPPMYSALKVDGKKLYELARQGIEVERKPRRVELTDIVIENIDLPLITFSVECSKGTYIRTLCHDIGALLGCGAAMESLVRTRVDNFRLEDAYTLSEVEEYMKTGVIKGKITEGQRPWTDIEEVFADDPEVRCEGIASKLLENGNPLRLSEIGMEAKPEMSARFRMYTENGRFAGVYEYKEGKLKPWKMFPDT